MSMHSYLVSKQLTDQDIPFEALIMAAMRRADYENARRLRDAFPLVWIEVHERYGAPGGWLPGERP